MTAISSIAAQAILGAFIVWLAIEIRPHRRSGDAVMNRKRENRFAARLVRPFCVEYFGAEVMTMIVTLPPEIEKKIIALAAQKNVDLASLVASLVEKELSEQGTLTPANGVGHTPEQKKAAQEWAPGEFESGIELPPGVSAQEVMDALRGDGTDDDDPDALKKATERITNRTPEEREAIRQELLKAIPEPLPIPEGKTVSDMFFRIRGNETEEQVYEALEQLS